MKKIISIDFYADFGMLKKPDTNEPVYLTYNMLHKPAVLGILGAIIGLSGFKERGKLPEYYNKLKDLPIGIMPLCHDKGNFQKNIITYNNSTGLASKETGGNLMVTEQTLVAPAYRCFLMLEMGNEFHVSIDNHLSSNNAEFIPYLGKNEFSLWWNNYTHYIDAVKFSPNGSFNINSIYIKRQALNEGKVVELFLPMFGESPKGNTFSYFECLPISYDEELLQYIRVDFAFTDWQLSTDYELNYPLYKINQNEIVQFF